MMPMTFGSPMIAAFECAFASEIIFLSFATPPSPACLYSWPIEQSSPHTDSSISTVICTLAFACIRFSIVLTNRLQRTAGLRFLFSLEVLGLHTSLAGGR